MTVAYRLVAALVATAALLGPAPAARAEDPVQVDAAIDGKPLAETTQRRPARLHPKQPATVDLRITNRGERPVEVRTVRIQGDVMGLTFFAYDTAVGVEVAPGATEARTFVIDLVGLGGQATGLVRGSLTLLDPERHTLASQAMVVDVRGSLKSVYGVFGVAVLVLTVLALGGALSALAHDALPEDRWPRGLRFAAPGVGLGLFVVFTLSALRILVPKPGVWVPILAVTGGLFFVAGCATPGGGGDDDDEDETGEGKTEDVKAGQSP